MEHRLEYELVATPNGFSQAARALASGRGPFAIDTERASAFRYDDRAFLIQIHRRDAGTFLFAPEGHREELAAQLGPVVNGADWIVHAAGEDLASLALLGLHPGRLFDTELAARFAGFERPNLGAMVQVFTGVELEKGHGREDWSTLPLPRDWLDYAALDVVYLHDLADALTEQLEQRGFLSYAEEEFAHLVKSRSLTPMEPKTWRDLKGLSAVRTQAGLQIAKELWHERDAIALERDVSPGVVLPNRVIIEIAKAVPNTPSELARVHGFPGRQRRATAQWFGYIETALAHPRDQWPERAPRDPMTPPSKGNWERNHPESWQLYVEARELIAARASKMGISPEHLLAPSTLRDVVWQAAAERAEADEAKWEVMIRGTDFAVRRLCAAGARQWQAEIVAPMLASAFLSVRSGAAWYSTTS